MVAMSHPQLNTLSKSATNPYSKRSFVTFLRGGIFEKNVKSYIKKTSKISLFEIWDFHFKGAKTQISRVQKVKLKLHSFD